MKNNVVVYSLYLLLPLCVVSAGAQAAQTDSKLIERGKYVVTISGCNDCHTPGYLLNDGNVPTDQWLKGDSFGWNGPWGTTYARNLRLFVKDKTEAQWIDEAKSLKRRPPMPWFNLNRMNDDDLRAVYHFIKSLGEPGEQAPAFLPPDQTPPMPFASFPSPPPKK